MLSGDIEDVVLCLADIYLYIANIHYSENFSILGTSPRKRLNYSKTFISKPLLADSFRVRNQNFLEKPLRSGQCRKD